MGQTHTGSPVCLYFEEKHLIGACQTAFDMKKLIFVISLLSTIFATTGCNILDDDDDLNGNPGQNITVPTQVQDFIATNYNGFLIDHSETEDLCGDVPVYEVELEDGPGPDIDLYFDLDWNFLFEATDIPNSALPGEVLATIQAQYPGYTIEPGSSERFDFPDGSVQYQVELENNSDEDVEVVLNADGSIVCTENSDDDDDDDDGGQTLNIPSDVLDFINSSYPGFQAQSAEQEDLCGDVTVYEVELEDGSGPDIDLYFDLDWNFLFEATDIPNAALPDEVLATIQAQYPGYTIEPGSSERFDFPDGSVQYQVELENNSDEDVEVLLNADGSIVCVEED